MARGERKKAQTIPMSSLWCANERKSHRRSLSTTIAFCESKADACVYIVAPLGVFVRSSKQSTRDGDLKRLCLMKYGFILRSIIIAFKSPSGLMNLTDFMEGVLLIFSTGFAPGSIYGSTLFVHCCCLCVPVWARYNHGPLVQGLQTSCECHSASV